MTAWRWKTLGASAFCFAVAVGVGWASSLDLGHLLRGLAEHRTVVTSAPFAASGLFLAVFMASLGLVFLFGKQATPQAMRDASARTLRGAQAYFLFILGSLLAAALAYPVQHAVVDGVATGRGYVPCPRPDRPRHQPDRWALPGPHALTERCPGAGADPNV